MPSPPSGAPDIVVVGGGPAGAGAAALLADWGHRVLLLTRPTPPAGWLAESIPGSARKLLARLGVLDAIEVAGLPRNTGNTVWWAGSEPRVESFPAGEHGFHVERLRLESLFLDRARAAGVDVRKAVVRSVAGGPGDWEIGTGTSVFRAPWLIDASGRAGVVARGQREGGVEPATLALVGRVPCADSEANDRNHTLVESHEDGWVWSVPITGPVRCVTAMIDPRQTDLTRGQGLERLLRDELGKVPRLMGRLAPGGPLEDVRACPATPYRSTPFAREGVLLIGDAGSFIDPLSSYGVKKALASAWLGAVTIHTSLTDPDLATIAVDFFDAHEREVYGTFRRQAIPFLEEAARVHGHRFWIARLEAARHPSIPEVDDGSPAAWNVSSPAVRGAFDRIRDAPTLALRAGSTLGRVQRPLISGNRIVMEPHLVSDHVDEGVRYVQGVDLDRMVRLAPSFAGVPELWAAYNDDAPAVPLPAFLAALAVAVAADFLEARPTRDGDEPAR